MLNKTYTLRRNPRMKMTAQNEIPPDHFVVTQADLENMFAAQSSMDGHDNSDRTKGVEADENRVHFYTSVTEGSILELNKILRALDIEMQCLALRLKLPSIPIELHIHSQGGDLFSGLAAVDIIRSLKSPVHTYVEGSVASAATLMSIVGTKRFMYKHSFMLIHQLSAMMVQGTHEQFKDELINQENLMDKMRAIYHEKTKISSQDLSDLLEHDLWLDAETCLAHGLIDQII